MYKTLWHNCKFSLAFYKHFFFLNVFSINSQCITYNSNTNNIVQQKLNNASDIKIILNESGLLSTNISIKRKLNCWMYNILVKKNRES